MARKYMFRLGPSGKVEAGVVVTYPDDYSVEGDSAVWDNQERAFYDATTGKFTIYDQLMVSAPQTAKTGESVTAMAVLPEGSFDGTVTFTVSQRTVQGDPIHVDVVAGEASQQFVFDVAGVYRMTASSEHHGSASTEVTVKIEEEIA